MFRRIAAILLVMCCLGIMSVSADSYYYNRKGESVHAPSAYVAGKVLDGETLGIGAFNGIEDLYVSEDGILYIADTGNNRIVVIDTDNSVKKVIYKLTDGAEEIELLNPQGVFYKDNLIYICNTGGQEVLIADDECQVVRRCVRPDSASLTESTEYKPSKVAVNASGSIFVQADGIYQGLIQYDSNARFVNFFGATEIEVTPAVVIQNMWKSLFSDEQREGLTRVISGELSNVFIDSEDFIFTVTSSVNTKQVRRLNAAGENILKYPGYDDDSLFTSGYNRDNFGDQESDYSKGKLVVSEISDIHVDSAGVLSVLDSARGKVFQYDSELNPLCIFAGTGEQAGYFRKASALEKRGDSYLIADSEKNSITCMEPTGYIGKIRAALLQYRQGDYAGAVDCWKEILNQNPSFTIAYRSIGRALLQEGNSKDALEYLREGDDRYYYSLAMQEYRREFIRNNWIWFIPLATAAVAAFIFGWRFLKKWIASPEKRRGHNE